MNTYPQALEEQFRCLLPLLCPDSDREGLKETPKRMAKAWTYWTSGYDQKVSDVLKDFEDGAEKYDEMVRETGIPFYSCCEHHLAPFFGTATIAYVPDGRIVGLSKMKRVVDIFARRLQVQERLTQQIADALMIHLKAKGVGVHLSARHLCMESRGIQCQGIVTHTTVLKGCFKEEHDTRAEFMAILSKTT